MGQDSFCGAILPLVFQMCSPFCGFCPLHTLFPSACNIPSLPTNRISYSSFKSPQWGHFLQEVSGLPRSTLPALRLHFTSSLSHLPTILELQSASLKQGTCIYYTASQIFLTWISTDEVSAKPKHIKRRFQSPLGISWNTTVYVLTSYIISQWWAYRLHNKAE